MNKDIEIIDRSKSYRYGEARSMSDEELKLFTGVFGTKENRFGWNLYDLDSFDKNYYKRVPLKTGERLFRIDSEKTRRIESGAKSLIKVNIDKNLIYFLTEEAVRDDKPEFEPRGFKTVYFKMFNDKADSMAKGGSVESSSLHGAISKAYDFGIKAHDNSKMRVSAQDVNLMGLLSELNLPIGGGAMSIMSSWEKGWDDARRSQMKDKFPDMYMVEGGIVSDTKKTKLVVIDGNTLAYILPNSNTAAVMSPKVSKGSKYHDYQTLYLKNIKNIRLASEKDFNDLGVVFTSKGYGSTDEYIYEGSDKIKMANRGSLDEPYKLMYLELEPLSTQLKALTGDDWADGNYRTESERVSVNEPYVIVHKKTGRKFEIPANLYDYVDGYNLFIDGDEIRTFPDNHLIAKVSPENNLYFSEKSDDISINRLKVKEEYAKDFIPKGTHKKIDQTIFTYNLLNKKKPNKDKFNYFYDRILKIAPDLMTNLEKAEYPTDVYGKSQYRTDDFGGDDAFMALSLEFLDKDESGRYIISLSHYYLQNGDMMCDPCMTVRLDPKLKTIEALTYRMDGVVGGGEEKSVYGKMPNGNIGVNMREKKDQNQFLNLWTNNLVKQGHKVKFKEIEESPFKEGDRVRTHGLPEKVKTYTTEGQPMIDNPYNDKEGTVVHYQSDDVRVDVDGVGVEGFLEANLTLLTDAKKEEPTTPKKQMVELPKTIINLIKFLNEEKNPRVKAKQWNGENDNEDIAYRGMTLPETSMTTLWQIAAKSVILEVGMSGYEEKVWFSGDDLWRVIKSKYDSLGKEVKPFLYKETIIEPTAEDAAEAYQDSTFFKGVDYEYSNQFQLNKAIEVFLDTKSNDYIFSDQEKGFIYKYEGYGGLEKEGATGKELLWEYYTPELLNKKMWGLAYKYGFQTGKVLEPSVGIGRVLDFAAPQDEITAYEISKYSARICKILHPKVDVRLESFEEHFYNGNVYNPKFEKGYDLVIGNPPYGKNVGRRSVAEAKRLKAKTSQFEHYFILRGLDVLNSGGLLIYISTANLFTKGYDKVKERILEKAELVDAYLLPNTTFKRTKINTSLIVLKRR